MRTGKSFLYFLILTIIAGLLIAGCGDDSQMEEQEETPAEEELQDRIDTTDTLTNMDEGTNQTVEPEEQLPELSGEWAGKFDDRNFYLTVTEQNKTELSGKTTITYREQINQQVKGSFDPETGTVTFTDQLHSRYAGTYNGKFNENFSKITGTFTMKADGSKFNFNLTKQ